MVSTYCASVTASPPSPTKPPFQQASTNYKEAFALFDKRGNGRVALESLGDLLRACGQNPTLAEIHELEKGVGGDCKPFPKKTSTNDKGRGTWLICKPGGANDS